MAAHHLRTLCRSAPPLLNAPPPLNAPTGETQSTCSAIWRHLPPYCAPPPLKKAKALLQLPVMDDLCRSRTFLPAVHVHARTYVHMCRRSVVPAYARELAEQLPPPVAPSALNCSNIWRVCAHVHVRPRARECAYKATEHASHPFKTLCAAIRRASFKVYAAAAQPLPPHHSPSPPRMTHHRPVRRG